MKNNMKRQRKLSTQLFTAFLLITTILMFITGVFIYSSVQNFHHNTRIMDLEARAKLLGSSFLLLKTNEVSRLQALCNDLAGKTNMRITLIAVDGTVMVDTEKDPVNMDNHADRPEIKTSLTGVTGHSIRYSYTINRDMLYVAVPWNINDETLTLRVSLPLERINERISGFYFKLILFVLALTALALIASYYISKKVTEPLEHMRKQAKKIAQGKFKHKIPQANSSEINSLAQSLNLMAQQLDSRIEKIISQKDEQEAILTSMVEGVFALDTNGQFITINAAAASLFHLDAKKCLVKKYYEVIRNSELLKFIESIYAGSQVHETDLEIINSGEKHLKVHGTTLKNARGEISGIVIVLNDISQIRYLEKVRQEFVSNVSHELKTPITAIQGFVETLKDVSDPKEIDRFLTVIKRHSDRLNSIIDDLLELSRFEEKSVVGQIKFENNAVKPILENAVEDCMDYAKEKKISLKVNCAEDLSAKMNSSLIREALNNLLNNAIRYSELNQTVEIAAEKVGDEIVISVKDSGSGIPAIHLDRIFERFYRVDRARSRAEGGTGLGLAIVKHIARVHNGAVTVKSVLEEGSTFTIHMPN